MGSRVRAVFFDVGETLLHPRPSFAALFARTLAAEGVPVEESAVEKAAAGVWSVYSTSQAWSVSEEASRRFWTHVYGEVLRAAGVQDPTGRLAARLYEVFARGENYELYPDALPVLEALAEDGYLLAVVSNFEVWIEEVLLSLGLGRIFRFFVISGREGVEKPDPAIYAIALERAGVSGEEAAHVGDSPVLDAEPASRLGILPILVDRRGRYWDLPWPRVTSLVEVRPLLNGRASGRAG